jgi:hypothetical protein
MEFYPDSGSRAGWRMGSRASVVGYSARSDARRVDQGSAIRNERGVWHYIANAFSLVIDRIAPNAAPAGPPPTVHSEFNVLQSPVDINPRFDR